MKLLPLFALNGISGRYEVYQVCKYSERIESKLLTHWFVNYRLFLISGRKNAEFTDRTKRTLAGRAGYQCSFPDCKMFLIGPHTDSEKTVSLGVAAHIEGAAPDSARYDINQSDDERKHISNGIWMCWNHSVQIDNDEEAYPVSLLDDWKKARENEAKLQFAKPVKGKVVREVLARADDHLRLDTDGKYRSSGMTVSFDPWKQGWFTMVKLSAEGEIHKAEQLVPLAVNSVKAYMASVGLRGQYLHILAQIRQLKLEPISQSYPPIWADQFSEFRDDMLCIDWSDTPGIDGAVFDLVAGNVKGTGEWDAFMVDITCLYPNFYSHYIDTKSE